MDFALGTMMMFSKYGIRIILKKQHNWLSWTLEKDFGEKVGFKQICKMDKIEIIRAGLVWIFGARNSLVQKLIIVI